MADNNTKTCSGDCMECSPMQRAFCAAQMSRIAIDRIDAMQEAFERIENKVDALINDNGGVFNPLGEEKEVVTKEEEIQSPEQPTFENAQ